MKMTETDALELANELKAAHLALFSENRRKHAAWLDELYDAFVKEDREEALVLKRSHFLEYFAERFPVIIQNGETIVGTDYHWAGMRSRRPIPTEMRNSGHFIADYKEILSCGVGGLKEKVNRISCGTPDMRTNKAAFDRVLSAFSAYIRRYAEEAGRLAQAAEGADRGRLTAIRDNCERIAEKPPRTFYQALQLVWFTQVFLETEAINAAVSFGRMDQYLYPYYERDIACGRLTEQEALFLICCFYVKASEGDESQMVTLGGADADGNNGENRLSVLFLQAMTHMNLRQPSICVRVRRDSSKEFLSAAAELTAVGSGMPAYFNDEVLERGLRGLSVDEAGARDYGIVGCYEASPQGAYSNTTAAAFCLYDSFADFLTREKQTEFLDFDDFFRAYKTFFCGCYAERMMPFFREKLSEIEARRSPFLACCLTGCLENGLLPEQYGSRYTLFGLNMLGIGMLIDSLYTVKKLVFERKELSLARLCEAAAQNFEDETVFEKVRALEGGYGSDSEESNRLAEELSRFIGSLVREYPLNDRILVSPALFWFTADIKQREYPAALNGRRKGELLSYGVSPCSTPRSHPVTLVLLSAAHICSDLFPDGCPLMLSLPSRDLKNQMYVRTLVKVYFESGGFHIAMNGVDARTLEEAMRDPESHQDVMVKISGFSAQYVGLSKAMQAGILQRAKSGV